VADLGSAVEEALAAARAGVPGPTFVECPVDLLYDETVIRGWYADAAGQGKSLADRLLRWYLGRHANRLFAGAREPYAPVPRAVEVPVAAETTLARAAAALARAERPLLVIGSQAVVDASAAAEVAAAVQRLGVPVYLSGMARGLLGRDGSPGSVAWDTNLQMRHARRKALREADCVLLAGVPCDFRLDYGKHVRRSATLIAANRSRKDARLNRTPAIAAIGDAGRFIVSLAERMGAAASRPAWIATLRERDAAREAEIDMQAKNSGAHVNPVSFFRALDRVAGDGAIFVADGGDFVATAAYILRPRGPLAWLDPGAFGTLGVGAGFALGAAAARPGAEVWLVWGDGASGYGLPEIDTFVRHGIPFIAVIGNDASWSQIAREQVKMLGDDVSTVLARTAYHEVAKGFGAEGLEIRRDEDVAAVLARARELCAAGRPVVVNVWLERSEFREGSISM
jgi:acetolactate synthase-1/2/3 large subunit